MMLNAMNRRPHLLMICSDQHAPQVTGTYGDQIVATPNLDRLAAEGCRFDACYCNTPLCAPSRMSFMTGRYAHRCEVMGNQDVLDSRIPTFAHMAVRGGYHTVLAGRMHFNGPDQRHGFLQRLVGEPWHYALYNGRPSGGPAEMSPLGNCSRPDPLTKVGAGGNPFVDYDHAVTDAAIGWLEQYVAAGDEAPPFLMTVGWLLPHCPYIAPPEVYDRYAGKVRAPRLSPDEVAALHPFHQHYRDKVIRIQDMPEKNFDAAATAYYAMVDLLDQNVGRLIDALKRLGLWDNTIIIYFSDHGEMLGRHGRWHKEAFYEEAARVPMIVRDPTRKLRSTLAEPRSLVDLLPTICDLVGVAPPPGIDGTSFLPVINGAAEPDPDQVIKSETYTWWPQEIAGLSSSRMVRRGPWKLSYYGAFDSYELFNLADDPEERTNLADAPEHRQTLQSLATLLFEDGWSSETARQQASRLEANGIMTNVNQFAAAIRRDPLPMDDHDYWQGVEQTSIWLRDEQRAGGGRE